MNIDTFDWIKSTFLQLTNKTYPFGFEDGLVKDMVQCGLFPNDLREDQFGNYYYKIGDSKTIFASHLDTACQDQVDVIHTFDVENKNVVIKTDGKSILGADDKAGVTILLWMMKHNIPGTYYFFYGEEVGCLGSTAASGLTEEFSLYDRMISFDRRSTNSVITHQSSRRTCSDTFAQSIANEFNKNGLFYHKDDTGIYTDSAEFVNVISECTNISVGYYNEHTTSEKQDITHLSKLADVVLLIDWDNLPTERDKSKSEYKSYSYSSYSSGYSGRSYSGPSNRSKRTYADEHDPYDMDHMSICDNHVNVLDCAYDNENPTVKRSRSRRKNNWKRDKKNYNSKVYIESGADLTEVKEWRNSSEVDHQYDMLKSKFLNHVLTTEDIHVLRDQYFDMNDPQDIGYYGHLISTYCTTKSKCLLDSEILEKINA